MEEITSPQERFLIAHRYLQHAEAELLIKCSPNNHNYLISVHLHLKDVIVFEWGISLSRAADHDYDKAKNSRTVALDIESSRTDGWPEMKTNAITEYS